MKAKWTQPKTIGLAERLREVTERLNAILPQIVEAQAKAVEGMAKTAIAANQKSKEEPDA
jgi:hypothetical protein